MTKPVLPKTLVASVRSSHISVVVIALVSVFLTTAVWGGFYFGFLREKWKMKQRILTQLVKREKLLAHLSHPEKYGALKNQLLIHMANLNPEQAIPNTADISDLLEAVATEANLANMVLLNFEEKQEQSLGLVVEIPIMMTLTGKYENLVQFLEGLIGLSRLTTVKNMHLTVFSSAEDHTMLTITLTLAAYRGQMS